jgi:hypothetical protein
MLRPSGVLSRYTRDLVEESRAGRLEPVRCREDEIARVVDILLRQSKNNPALVGAAGVRFPATRLTDTSPGSADLPLAFELTRGVWLKRGDLHASVSADVQRVGSRDELAAGLANFRARGIARAALQEHRNGAEVKFYGVAGGAFFHWFFTNGSNDRAPDAAALQHLAEAAAAAAGLDVFGGDVIVEPSGELTLIDLNDWPSFAPCREAASRAIADYLMRRVHAVWKPGLVPSANQSAV